MQFSAFFSFPRGWKCGFRCFLAFQGVGNAACDIFRFSQVWESHFSLFFSLPKFGKAIFFRFSFFPSLGKAIFLIFSFSQSWECISRWFLIFSRGEESFFRPQFIVYCELFGSEDCRIYWLKLTVLFSSIFRFLMDKFVVFIIKVYLCKIICA